MKKLIGYLKTYSKEILIFLLFSLFLLNFFSSYDQKMKIKVQDSKIESLTKMVDSLKSIKLDLETEKFILETELTRHEITREEIFRLYPKVGQDYEYFISHFTE